MSHLTKKQCERMRAAINRVDAGPRFLEQYPELREAYAVWARQNVIPDMQQLLPEGERVKFAKVAESAA